jgi:hypothetical protein
MKSASIDVAIAWLASSVLLTKAFDRRSRTKRAAGEEKRIQERYRRKALELKRRVTVNRDPCECALAGSEFRASASW